MPTHLAHGLPLLETFLCSVDGDVDILRVGPLELFRVSVCTGTTRLVQVSIPVVMMASLTEDFKVCFSEPELSLNSPPIKACTGKG